MTLNPGQRRTMLFVGLVMGAGLVLLFRAILPAWAFYLALGVLAIEGFTIVDRYVGNTISEGIWLLSNRPLVPLLFGMAVGAGLAVSLFSPPVAFGLGVLYGHFFWQSQTYYASLWRAPAEVKVTVEQVKVVDR